MEGLQNIGDLGFILGIALLAVIILIAIPVGYRSLRGWQTMKTVLRPLMKRDTTRRAMRP